MRRFVNIGAWTRFFVSLSVCVLVMMFALSWSNAVASADQLIADEQREDKVEASERRQASNERKEILQGQRDLQIRYNLLAVNYNNLLNYLQQRGTYIPPELIDDQLGRIKIESNDNGNDNDNEHSPSVNSDREPRRSISPAPVNNGGDDGGNKNSDQRPDTKRTKDSRRDDKANRGSNEKSNKSGKDRK